MADVSTEIAIASQTLGSAASSITFSSIPSTYTDLRVILVASGASTEDLGIQLNSDTGTNYSKTILYGNGSSASSGRTTSANQWQYDLVYVVSTPKLFTLDIFSYAGSTYKTGLLTASGDTNGSGVVSRMVGLWRSTAAVNTIKLYGMGGINFATGTTATLYGIL